MNKKLLILLISTILISLVFLHSENTLNNRFNLTREDAIKSINETEKIKQRLEANDIPSDYYTDKIKEMNELLEKIDLSEILKGNIKVSYHEKKDAEKKLESVNWKALSYKDITDILERLNKRENQAYNLKDKLLIEEGRLLKKSSQIDNETLLKRAEYLFLMSKKAFEEERYEESETLLEQSRKELDLVISEKSIIIDLRNSLIGFYQKYWKEILLILLILVTIIYISYKKIKKYLLKKLIEKMKTQKIVLMQLMKKAQTDRYKKNTIPGLIYNIRMKSYKDKLNNIKQELPVYEAKLNSLIRGKLKPKKSFKHKK